MYIEYFGYTYGKQNIDEKKYNRSIRWILLDIEMGDLVKLYDCTDKDFSAESNGKVYSLDDLKVKKANEDYFSVINTLFDISRASVIYGKNLDKATYKAYLNNLYAIIPQEYKVFYKELSI